MNRKIKFRLWNPERKVITGGHELNMLILSTDSEFVKEFNNSKMIWMQWTGLKDKNGKEIYEGDICFTESKEYPRNKQVVWNDGIACFEFDYPIGKSLLSRISIEVIGNIYENPELINQTA